MAGTLEVVGGAPLCGVLRATGSRSATLAHLAAALMADGEVFLSGASTAGDVVEQARLVAELGCRVERDGQQIRIRPAGRLADRVPAPAVWGFQPLLLFAGPLLARHGRARLPLPGASELGPLSLDLHVKGLRAMGAKARIEGGELILQAQPLRGADIFIDEPSVGATLNLMMAAVGADGRTTIRHAARDPEVVDVASLLMRMGARIRGAGTDEIVVEGGIRLGSAQHRVIPDRHEAGLLLIAAATTSGELTMHGVEPLHLRALLSKLADLGLHVAATIDTVTVSGIEARLRSGLVRALPYPGFPGDLLLPILSLLAQAEGTSIAAEGAFPDHLISLDELRRIGVRAAYEGGSAVIHGGQRLTGAPVKAQGPYSASALLVALLSAEGVGRLDGAETLLRRSEGILDRLSTLGATLRWRAE